MVEQPSYSTTKNGKRLIYIDGVGWRYAIRNKSYTPVSATSWRIHSLEYSKPSATTS